MGLATSASAFARAKILAEIEGISSAAQIDTQIKRIAGFYIDGALSEPDYEALTTVLQTLRTIFGRARTVGERIPGLAVQWQGERRSVFKPRLRLKMPKHKKAEYLERRRDLAVSGLLPREVGSKFTTGQLAALTVIAQEVGKFGHCSLFIDKIAALAGVCHATVRRAVNAAKDDFLQVAYRERKGKTNLSNVITVKHKGWREWIKRRYGRAFDVFAYLRKKAADTPAMSLSSTSLQKCYPTPSTIKITGNRLPADYDISISFARITDSSPPFRRRD